MLCIAAPFSGTPGDESCMRDAKSRVRDEKELVVYSGTRNQDHLQTTGCVGAVLGPVELVTCILVEWERRLIFNIFNIFNISPNDRVCRRSIGPS